MGNHNEKEKKDGQKENNNNLNKEKENKEEPKENGEQLSNTEENNEEDKTYIDIYNTFNFENDNYIENIYFIDNKTNREKNNIFTIHKVNKKRFIKKNSIRSSNIMRKIKLYFTRFIIDFIHEHLINKYMRLKRLNSRFNLDMSKKKNERLLNMKIVDILYEQENRALFNNLDNHYNRKIIDKIYEEKKEINVIKILELTFKELFIIFRRKLNDPEDIKKLEEIKDKTKGLDLFDKNKRYLDISCLIDKIKIYGNREYIEKVKYYCLIYENYFTSEK